MLELLNISHEFQIKTGFLNAKELSLRAVDDVSLKIIKGECFGIVGESGCGKSTLGKIAVGLLEPSSGEVKLEGRALEIGDVQMIFQDPFSSLNPRLSVGKSITEPLKNISKAEKQEKLNEILQLIGLDLKSATRYPHEFSGGQRQRIAIARALITRPPLIVCDEAVSALDASVQANILNLLNELRESFDLSYVFISHDLAVVSYMSDRIAVMYLGKIVEQASRAELINNPLHPYTVALLSAAPVRDPNMREKLRKERQILKGELPSPLAPPSGCTFHPRCPKVMDICKKEIPVQKNISDNHTVCCHLY